MEPERVLLKVLLHVVARASSMSRSGRVRDIERHVRGFDRLQDYLFGTLQEKVEVDLSMCGLPSIDDKQYAGS